ncbi:hypothetical protein M758_1G030300 [Ceratodon purpureus]|nr:hypothetical protein M758_1G030300 [Ceratodon purpureus]
MHVARFSLIIPERSLDLGRISTVDSITIFGMLIQVICIQILRGRSCLD